MPVSLYYHYTILDNFAQLFASCLVRLNDFQVYIIRYCPACTYRKLASTNDYSMFYRRIVFLSSLYADKVNIFLFRHKEHEVIHIDTVVSSRNDSFTISLYCNYMEKMMFLIEFLERFVYENSCLMHLYAYKHQFSVIETPPLTRPAQLNRFGYFLSGKHLRINQRTDAHTFKQFLMFWFQVFIVVNSCDSPLCTKLLCQHAAHDILAFVRGNCDKQICMLDTCILQAFY